MTKAKPKPAAKKKSKVSVKTAKRSRKREEQRVFTGNVALHDLFAQQARAVLDSTDIGEEEKQLILVGMTCPCCGTGAMSMTVKVGPKPASRFFADSGKS